MDSKIVQVIGLIIALYLAQKVIRRMLSRVVRRVVKSHRHESEHAEKQREDTLINIFRTASALGLWLVGIIGSLMILDINLMPLLTGAGVVGIVIGFGAQSTIKDALAGVFIILENQYRVGDVIAIAGVEGMVEDITIRITKLRDLDGDLHIIPNGEAKVITNKTFGWSNVNINVGVSYDADIEKVSEIINNVGKELAEDETWKASIIQPIEFLRVENFGDTAVSVKALGKVQPGDQWDVAGEFRRRIKLAFKKAKIDMPLVQRVIQHSKTS